MLFGDALPKWDTRLRPRDPAVFNQFARERGAGCGALLPSLDVKSCGDSQAHDQAAWSARAFLIESRCPTFSYHALEPGTAANRSIAALPSAEREA